MCVEEQSNTGNLGRAQGEAARRPISDYGNDLGVWNFEN